MTTFKFDPERKRRQLRKRGWSEKRIDAYMRHSTQFNAPSAPAEKLPDTHYERDK